MAWHSGKPADGDFLSASVQHIRENFAELEPLHPHIGELVDLTTLHPHIGELVDLTALQPHVAALLDSRIVEMGSNENGEYVRWENGLQVCFARRTALHDSAAVISSFWTFPASFINANYAIVFGLGDRPTIAGNPDPYTKTLWLHAYARTASACELRLLVNDGSAVFGDSATFDAVAVGRWK